MPYVPPYPGGWEDTPSTDTLIDAAALNAMDAGIGDATDEAEAAASAIAAHLADGTDAHDASAISFAPAGTIGSTDVQAAIEELEDDILGSGIPATVFDNKGELIAADAADSVATVTAATADGLVLTSDAAEATGMKWAAASGGGAGGPTFLVASSEADAAVRAAASYVCDGTDDHVQIQAAIDALPAWGGKVALSEGRFYIGATVAITSNYVALEGAGRITTQMALAASANVDVLSVSGQVCMLSAFGIDGSSATNASSGNGIVLTNTKNVVSDVWITACREHGIRINGTVGTPAHACRVRDSFILSCAGDGVALQNYCYDAIIDNVWVGTCAGHGFSTASGEQRFQNCHAWGNTVDGIRITAATEITVVGCYLETNGGRGLRATGGSHRVRIIGCHLYRNTSNGVYGFSSNYWLIEGCHFTENGFGTGGVPGINMDTGTHWTVTGNIFRDAQGTKTQTYAMTDTGGADYAIFLGNVAMSADHKTGSINISGANRRVLGNQGPSDFPATGVDVQAFTANGTWTKPAAGNQVTVVLIGGGGGGGSGRRGATSTRRNGGGGGGGGARTIAVFQASDLGATVAVTAGAGGTGGTAISSNDTNGNNGNAGGSSAFGSHVFAAGGGGGGGGQNGDESSEGSSFGGGAGGRGAGPQNNPANAGGTTGNGAGPGGGGGFGLASDNTNRAGADGGGSLAANLSGGAAGSAGSSYTGVAAVAGSAGGGASSAGSAGQNGGSFGAGGGGGGGNTNGSNSGAGGNGGSGVVLVVTR